MDDDLTGQQAHAAGRAISECPYPPADPQGHEWRRQWIRAEALAQRTAGTFGASDQQYRAAGLTPPARLPDGRPMTSAQLTPEQLAAITAAFAHLGETVRRAARQLAQAIAVLPWDALRQIRDDLADPFARHGVSIDNTAPPDPPRPTGRHRVCPRHGVKAMRSGNCLTCQRELNRRSLGHRG